MIKRDNDVTVGPGNGLFQLLAHQSDRYPESIRIYTGRASVLQGPKQFDSENVLITEDCSVIKDVGDTVPKRGLVVSY